MARSLLFGTSVSPGIAIGVLRFAHNVQTVEMRTSARAKWKVSRNSCAPP